ncbi:hypothetical protein CPT_Paku_018 [Burkholderia phage Paku]|uniref:Uncharacterized protein n=1 Tax=Burkholderia phage Paku TaxID=2859650 RepID=A0AAE7WMZ6_9CAUD|nr:hypothetical protein CPT_Paku_018 [Burkholderia phage Paku]
MGPKGMIRVVYFNPELYSGRELASAEKRVVYFNPELYSGRELASAEKRIRAVVLFGCITLYRADIERE